MRTRGELVAGLAIAMATLIMGVISSGSSGAATPGATCTFVTTQAQTPSPGAAAGRADPDLTAPAAQSSTGSLTVTIPPVVFVRAEGRHLHVTTNTGRPPVATDQFFTLTGTVAEPTTAQVRELVLTNCRAHGHH